MSKRKDYIYTNDDALNMINQGYEDYLCARYLLGTNHIRHATIHASTAV